MGFRMEGGTQPGTLRYTLSCACGASRSWDNEPCYVEWRRKVAREGWKADWPERCATCAPPRKDTRMTAMPAPTLPGNEWPSDSEDWT